MRFWNFFACTNHLSTNLKILLKALSEKIFFFSFCRDILSIRVEDDAKDDAKDDSKYDLKVDMRADIKAGFCEFRDPPFGSLETEPNRHQKESDFHYNLNVAGHGNLLTKMFSFPCVSHSLPN
jgi:hypothetical protein